jgi:endonuclease YncB( thermonuclease family)
MSAQRADAATTKLASPLRRRRVLSVAGYIVLALLLATVVFARRGGDDWGAFDRQTVRIERVVDANVLRVIASSNRATDVRLIGIDAPTSAITYLSARVAGKSAVLRLEPTQTRDHHGRLLAYLYLSDLDCLNLDMIRDGQAFADRRYRHTYRPQFELAEAEARKKQRGLWKDLTEEQMPQWRREWLKKVQERKLRSPLPSGEG